MRIYTRQGDAGETSLGRGARVPKDSARVEAYGTVDELIAHLGVACAALRDAPLATMVQRLQRELMDVAADLAAPLDARPAGREVPRVTAEHIAALEGEIDCLEAGLAPLRGFILPGGTPAAAALHVARCVCRRAERRVASLARSEKVNPACLAYLNRLSDLLFTLARAANASEGVAELPWKPV